MRKISQTKTKQVKIDFSAGVSYHKKFAISSITCSLSQNLEECKKLEALFIIFIDEFGVVGLRKYVKPK
ncbi:MAG: hypothetical protein EAY75_01950 [Bacteroidetes bacterium]|nr:MAG: hypothetical protein EAY75_01950 [Bacteroidota bacterium]